MKKENENSFLKYEPAKPWYVRLWRKFFPLKGIHLSQFTSDEAVKKDKVITETVDGYIIHYYPDGSTEIHKKCICMCEINWILGSIRK